MEMNLIALKDLVVQLSARNVALEAGINQKTEALNYWMNQATTFEAQLQALKSEDKQ